MQELLLDVTINKKNLNQTDYFLKNDKKEILVSKSSLKKWKLPIPKNKPFIWNKIEYYKLKWLPLKYSIDEKKFSINLTVPPKLFPSSLIDVKGKSKKKERNRPEGMFVNYNISALHTRNKSQTKINSLIEIGGSNIYGFGNSNFLFKSSDSSTNNANNNEKNIVRLTTNWTYDDVKKMQRWKFGDSVMKSIDDWNAGLYFGGIQWSSNFDTQPDFTEFALPKFDGIATIPSDIDVIVEGRSRLHKTLDSGPFTLQNIPVTPGGGEISILTKDILGNEHISVVSYYTSKKLLKPGTQAFSYELGFTRKNFSQDSNTYGEPLVGLTSNKGINNNWTFGWHIEAIKKKQNLSLRNNNLWNNFGILSTSLVISNYKSNIGLSSSIGFHRKNKIVGWGFDFSVFSKKFNYIGLSKNSLTPHFQNRAFINFLVKKLGSFDITHILRKNRKKESIDLLSIGYRRNVGEKANFYLRASSNFNKTNDKAVYFGLTYKLNATISTSINSYKKSNKRKTSVQLQRNILLEKGKGYGYKLEVSKKTTANRFRGDLFLQNNIGEYIARYSHSKDNKYYQLNAAGSIVYLGKELFLTKKIKNSYALIQIPGFSEIDIYNRNQLIGKTNKNGNLLIPNLTPYIPNNITIDPKKLPLDSEIESTEDKIIPSYRSGSIIKFKAHKVYRINIILLDSSGKIIPSGSRVKIKNYNQEFFVGLDGKLSLTINKMLNKNLTAQVSVSDKIYNFSFNIPQKEEDLYDLGEITCQT